MAQMTDEQDAHMFSIIDSFNDEMSQKYPKAVAKYGDNLWEKTPLQLVKEAKQEALDQYAYLHTLEQVIKASK